ncbi:unnamed protein product [Adineta ricciae]|uniref:Uncharacterized protein n=2 Tax=Adineta ricciae TaxID=249248 RepID=A0A815QBT0_ADIRI|nr:unnamed protein product [Adineta ricciae]
MKIAKITSESLIEWSAPINVAEHYQKFLNDVNELSSSQVFYNCTKGWFGHRCQYTLYHNELTFSELVKAIFLERRVDTKWVHFTNGTCYIYLSCDRGPNPACLDWREICDGKRDCIDGIDEPQECFERESNECPEGYYRCHNGQCIPDEFNNDEDLLNPDCMDWTDVTEDGWSKDCDGDPAFRCEEHICKQQNEFSCGDGQCIVIFQMLGDTCKHNRFRYTMRHLIDYHFNSYLSEKCLFMMACLTRIYRRLIYDDEICEKIVLQAADCPSTPFLFPLTPVAFGHVHFIYTVNGSSYWYQKRLLSPFLICYDEELCGSILNTTVIYYNGYTCQHYSNIVGGMKHYSWIDLMENIYSFFRPCAPMIPFNCTNLFRCEQSSKCISKHRLLDGRYDCMDHSDEQFNNTCALNDPYRFQCSSKRELCISPLLLLNDQSDCPDGEDEKHLAQTIGYELFPPFPMFCDGRTDMDPFIIDDREQTDETDCGSYFPCDNPHTHCDGFWHCINGIDEANCSSSLCKPYHHPCVSLINMSMECLPIEFAGDGTIHCRGGSDERHYCRNMFPDEVERRYRCLHQSFKCIKTTLLCDRYNIDESDDSDLCDNEEVSICPDYYYNEKDFTGICWPHWKLNRTVSENILCNLDETNYVVVYNFSDAKLYLRLIRIDNYPPVTQNISYSNENSSKQQQKYISSRLSNTLLYYTHRAWFCNRGIVIFTGTLDQRRCLCPPPYYGDQCQFQNQRVSLTLKFTTQDTRNFRTAFYIITMLIDDEYVIQSYDYNIYIPIRDCEYKFHLYLTYASRPKNSSKNYSIIVRAFNKQTLTYYTSWYLTIPFQFLPVNHLVERLIIREQNFQSPNDCQLKCHDHGQCMKYENTGDEFCQCFENWWGKFCEKSYHCDCSSDSKCIGTINNQSICLCPLNRYGSQCYLTYSSCQDKTCQHGGTCVPYDDRKSKENFTCLCTKEYTGERCEIFGTKIIISFDETIIPETFFAHFITTIHDDDHIRTTILQKLPYAGNEVTLYRPTPFHILFVEFSQNYYLTILQENYLPLRSIYTKVLSSNHCPSIHMLFNQTILNYHRLQRIKYYHLPCQMNTRLKCFYDEAYMCLCNLDHYAICFDFIHNMTYNCQGTNYCKNNGKCFQDHPTCPTSSTCSCDECFFGSYCQLSTKGFDISLDSILSYHIHSHLTIFHQPFPLKVAFIATIILFLLGIISACLSLIVFRPKNFQSGCAIYLFASSINSLLTMIVFLLKFILLLFAQMDLITNRSILLINCISSHFLIKFLPNISDWLNACVAIERIFIIWQEVKFNKIQSISIAKRMIFFIYIIVIPTAIHDPIYRQLIEDETEERILCIVEYSSNVKIFNLIINIIHLFVPFIANLVSAISIVTMIARRRSNIRTSQTYSQSLCQEVNEHKHLIVSSCVLVICVLPRIIMSLTVRCMKSARDPWLYLIGYFFPFIPSISIFVVFVLPSKTYTKLFKQFFH